MTFADLPLYKAVYRVFMAVEKPGSDEWISQNAKTAYKLVLLQIVDDEAWTEQGIPYSQDRVIEVWRTLRKNLTTRLKCQVASMHGSRCFYANRGLGACSEEVDLDRIVPEDRGGKYTVENCVVVCSFHNRSRGKQSVEEYVMRGQVGNEITGLPTIETGDGTPPTA